MKPFEIAKNVTGLGRDVLVSATWGVLKYAGRAIKKQWKWTRLPKCTFCRKERCARKGGKATKCNVRYDEKGLLRAWDYSEYVSCRLNITKEKFKGV